MGTDSRDVTAVYSDSGRVIGHRSAGPVPVFVGSVLVLAQSGALGAIVTGTTAETVVQTITVPGGLLGPNGALRLSLSFSMTASANIKTLRAKYGGPSGLDLLAGRQISTATTVTVNMQRMMQNRGATNAQVAPSGWSDFGVNTTGNNTGAIDSTQEQQLQISVQLASAADSIRLEAYALEALPSE